jgi:hypothetical protein
MPTLERRISLRGPRFWRDGGALMFARQLDASTREGPRPATDADKAAFPDALARADVETDAAPGAAILVASEAEAELPRAGRRR